MLQKSDLEDNIAKAQAATARRDWAAALELWQIIARQFPDRPDGFVGMAGALVELGRLADAEGLLVTAMECAPTNLWVFVHHAMIASGRRDWDEARQRWDTVRTRFPDAPQGYVGIGRVLCDSGRFEEADTALLKAMARFPDERWAAVQYALVAVARKDWQAALSRWHFVRDRFPEALEGYIGAVKACAMLGEIDAGHAILSQAAEKFTGNPEAAIQLARAAMSLQQWDIAAAQWSGVRAHFPDEPEGYSRGADALEQAGRLAEADEVLELGTRRFPANDAMRMAAVRLALARGDRPRALRQWHALAASSPERYNPRDRGRLELRKQIALARPGFDARTIDVADWVPGTVISEDPVIILSDCPAFELVERVGPYYQGRTIYFFIGMLWTLVGDPALRTTYREAFDRVSNQYPTFRITVLANDAAELLLLRELGIPAELMNQNAFIDEKVFDILPIEQTFDAIYNARLGGYKRHELAAGIRRLKLIVVDANAENLQAARELLPGVVLANEENHQIRKLTSQEVTYHLNTAKCGLCLSAIEGAMFSSVEYLLCGLPVVTTENSGGRNWFFSHEHVIFCEADPASVASAVARLNGRKISRHLVREATLQRIKRERLVFYELVNRVFRENGQEARRAEVEFGNMFYDKINYTGRQIGEFLVPEPPGACSSRRTGGC